MADIGPVQVLAVGFGPEAKLEGKILDELAKLDESGTVRVPDLLFVRHDADSGDVVALDVQGENLGAIAGALLGFEFESDGEGAPAPAGAVSERRWPPRWRRAPPPPLPSARV
jgi:hypothetical protein